MRIPVVNKLLEKNKILKKLKIYFSSETVGDSFDPYEGNTTTVNLNPVTIKVIATEISYTSLVWRQYGLKNAGSLKVTCDKNYKTYFEQANQIEDADGNKYQVFKEGTGGRSLIKEEHYNLISVILMKV